MIPIAMMQDSKKTDGSGHVFVTPGRDFAAARRRLKMNIIIARKTRIG
jgi:hypothetical protein